VNNALFSVTNPSQLVGTGFDQDGATGWVTTIAPCTGGETMSLTFEIYDVADGVWDSAVMIDNLQFSETPPPGDGPWTGDDTPENPIDVFFVSPKEGALDGGNAVTLYGVNFTPDITVYLGGAQVTDITVGSGGDSLILNSVPDGVTAGTDADGGPVDIILIRGLEEVTLGDAYTYWEGSGGDIPPRVTSVFPSSANPGGGTEIRVRGVGFVEGATVAFIDADGNVEGEVQSVQAIEGGMEVSVLTPEHDEGWVEILVTNPSGLSSDPGYPFQFTTNAAPPPANGGGSGRNNCGSSVSASHGGGAGLLMLLLLASGLVRRRQ